MLIDLLMGMVSRQDLSDVFQVDFPNNMFIYQTDPTSNTIIHVHSLCDSTCYSLGLMKNLGNSL